jgi:hypothetical protein
VESRDEKIESRRWKVESGGQELTHGKWKIELRIGNVERGIDNLPLSTLHSRIKGR